MAVYQFKNSSSYSGLANHFIEGRQDVIFRKVRGILNKITPETFDKLSKELVNVGLDSPRTLRGVIYLLFDKALKDLKYSSLYAKLCQELSERAPNFEQGPGPNTFCKFLISKCEDEFERRRKANEDFDGKSQLTDEEYEQKAIVKQKMLGNIKFICELGKKRLLQEEILHECIRGLLSKKKERPIHDQAQDLECLCQIMRTIGSLLDIKASKNLMNQYFERIDMFSKKTELPPRIRFMLKDVIDLRNNNWRPRPFQREDNVPQPLSKLREEGGYDLTINSTNDKTGNRGLGISDPSKLYGNKLSMLIDDGPSFTTSTDFHWGPSFLSIDNPFDAFSSSTSATKQNQPTAVFSSSANSAFSSLTSPAISSAVATNNNANVLTQMTNVHRIHPFQQNDPFLRHDMSQPLNRGRNISPSRPPPRRRPHDASQHNSPIQPPPPHQYHQSHNSQDGPIDRRDLTRRYHSSSQSQDHFDTHHQSNNRNQNNGISNQGRGNRQPVKHAQKFHPTPHSGDHFEPHHHQSNNRSQNNGVSNPDRNNRPQLRHSQKFNSSSQSQDHFEPHHHQSSTRNQNNEVSNQERKHRPQIRPLQSDNSHTSESDRISNWRRGVSSVVATTNSNNMVSIPKETTTINSNPLLTRPPPKIIDRNFSLRPSHNLIGRSILGNPNIKPSNYNLEPGSAESSSKDQSDSQQANNKPNNLSHVPAKTGTDINSDKRNELKSSSSSPTRNQASEFHVNKFMSILTEYSNESTQNMARITTKIKELKIPKNYQHACLLSAIKQSIPKAEGDRENVEKLFVQLIPSIFDTVTLSSAYKAIFEQMKGLEVETPKVKSIVAGFLSRSILDGLLTLEEVGSVLSGGKHHPLFLLVLQKLEKSAGQEWLNEKFVASKINLMEMLPEIDRSKDRLASILKDRCLGFLDPMLTIEPDLWDQLKEHDATPASVYRWIKDNVDQSIQGSSTFAHVLISCILKFIHNVALERSKDCTTEKKDAVAPVNEGTDSPQSAPLSPQTNTSEIEKELLTKYQQMLQAILKDKRKQLATLYALQSFYHGLEFPKGSLLRWFHMLYDLNIVDDDVFFIWKEEINDEYPGKGQALFQVNTWLNWLAESESEEEEDV